MVVVVMIWIICGIAGGMVMSGKGNSGAGGFALGFLLGPLGLILALVIPGNPDELERQAVSGGAMKKCEKCAELVKAEAVKYKHCGADLVTPQA